MVGDSDDELAFSLDCCMCCFAPDLLAKWKRKKARNRREAAKREEEERNAKTTTITEITTTTTTSKKKRSRKDIFFNTSFRRQASLHDLHEAGCVSDETAEQLELGVIQEEEVEPSLHRYLSGEQPISGVIIKKANNKKMSINEAMARGIIMAGTGLGLLEAQAACGNIIDPHTGEMMGVDDAIKKGLADKKYEDALQRAERAVYGYTEPVTGRTLSLYEAMKKNFVVESHGIRLLEAQIATGGLIDPRASHRVPISVAYRRGLFDERMNAILEDPSDDTKGFFDPNTKKNHTYLELMGKSKVDPDTGVRLLEFTRDDVDMKRVTMDLSEIRTKRRSRRDIRFKTGFRREASLLDIFDAGLITEEQMVGLEEGEIKEEDLASQLRQYLFGGEEPIAGVILPATGEKLSINEAVRRSIIKRGTGIELLEAQAATGNIIDPSNAKKLSVDEAAKAGLIDRLHVDTLQRAERAVYGYKLPGTNKLLSLFEAMKKGLVVESRGIRLLEAQIATGGLIDPRASHRVPISVAYKRGLFDERMNQILEDPSDDTKGFFDPNTQENLSYLELMERCVTDESTGLRFLVLEEKKSKRRSRKEETVTKEVKKERTKKDKSRKSHSEEKTDANGKVTKKTTTVEKITVTHETATKKEGGTRDDITFKTGYRREAKLKDLVKTGVVSEETAVLLEAGTLKHSDVYKQIRRNLVGDEPIGGVLVISTKEKLSINEAAKRGFLTRGTALQFLEAQAATGNIIDPKSGERLAVMDAYSSGLIERLHIDPLERAERAVLGYQEKGTQNVLSLFECMRKGLVTESRGIRLLEAQIATGGLIDPKVNHRVPIAAAYKQGIFDERMNEILEDPSDDTKGFFDPNTQKNSSYLQLIQKCVIDPKTGIKLLEVRGKGDEAPRKLGRRRSRKDIRFKTGFLRTASLMDLLEAGILTEETVVALEGGVIAEDDVATSIHQYLHGEQPIAGLILEASGEKLSILEGIQQGIIKRGTGLELLEAQAATGTIINPRTGERMSVTDAFGKGLIDNTQRDALERAQRAVTGYRDPISGQTLSLFQAMKKGYVTESRGIRLLEAQIATGGLIDPNAAHRVPISVAYRRGIFDEKLYQILDDPSDDTKGFFDPNTQANLTYLELMSRCEVEPDSGMVFLVLRDKRASKRSKRSSSSKKKHRTTQRTRKVVIVDPDTGKELSVREAQKKGLIDSATARQLMAQEGEWQETEEITSSSKKVPPSEQAIVDSKGANITIDDAVGKSLVDKGTAEKFKLGEISAEELTSRLALLSHGSQGPVGAILDVKKGECITIAEAERRRLVDGTTAQRLLEAQAATGGVINPTDSARLSISDAVSKNVIDKRMGQKIEKAELAYKGFADRRSKELMSLGEAMKKGLCYYDAGMRLLEYQYVTGGLVDYKNGERVSVDEAIERNWIDKRQADRLTDLRRYARSIVDLKTNLLLTYPEALEQAQVDTRTGLRIMEALPRLDRNARMAGGLTIRAGSMQSSLSSSLASSRAESPIGSPRRRGSFDDDSGFATSPSPRK